MNFRLDDSEVHTLVELLSLATMVAEWNQLPAFAPRMAAINALEDKIFEHLLHAGYDKMVCFDEEEQVHVVTEEFEKRSSFVDCYNEFREEAFWEELVVHLADRDLTRMLGEAEFNRMPEEERRTMALDIEKRYWREIEKNGVKNIHLIHPVAG